MKNLIILFVLIITSSLFSQVPFNTSPGWISNDASNVATGGSFADINNDGWMDLVTANGNDINRQKISVFLNDGAGNISQNPSWNSNDIDYHGHLDVGDVNNDGWTDVVVSVYLGANGFNDPGRVKLYLNNNGTLSSTPDWQSQDEFFTFSCALGDADNDGDLDLAVATGESYNNDAEKFRIYYNNGGMFESTPSWQSQNFGYAYDVNWFDYDNDGDLDVVFACEQGANEIYLNNSGTIQTTPVWQSTDASQQANSLSLGDVNNDGFIDLAISDNDQLGGEGRFKLYLNNNGSIETTPYWQSSFSGYGSGIFLIDLNNDDYDDLVTGGWWNPIRIYMNNAGSFTSTPQYTSSTGSVVEVITFSDVDKDQTWGDQFTYTYDGSTKLYYIPDPPIQSITSVYFDDNLVSFSDYCYDLETGWISFGSIPSNVNNIIVNCQVSYDQEMGITNWDSNKGNYIFENLSAPVPVELISFSAKVEENKVKLEWATSSEINNRGFEIYRKCNLRGQQGVSGNSDLEGYLKVGFIEGNGTTTENHNYSFADENIDAGKYFYRLKQIDYDGSYKYSRVVEVSFNMPDKFVLYQNYPNPFNPSTTIKFTIPETSLRSPLERDSQRDSFGKRGVLTNLVIYDILGNEVTTLVNEVKEPGIYEVTFNASEFTAGIYFYELTAVDPSTGSGKGFISTKKMILLK